MIPDPELASFVTARRLALQSQCRPAPHWQCPKCDARYPLGSSCPVCDAIVEAMAKETRSVSAPSQWDICKVCDLPTLYCRGH